MSATPNSIWSFQHRLGPGSPNCQEAYAECLTQHPFLPSLPSILRKALDKIAEIKSLLEERRIGEWEKMQARCGFGGKQLWPWLAGSLGHKLVESPDSCLRQAHRQRVCLGLCPDPGNCAPPLTLPWLTLARAGPLSPFCHCFLCGMLW